MLFKILVLLGGAYLIYRSIKMNESLTTAIDGLVAEVAESNGKLDSIKAFVTGVPALVAAAVGDALAAADVEQNQAADQINAARDAVSARVDETLAAIDANPAPGDDTTVGGEPTGNAGTGDGTDTQE